MEILLRQPDEIISLHNPQKPKGEKGSATDDGKFIKHFIGDARNKGLGDNHFSFFSPFTLSFRADIIQMMNAPTSRPKCTSINRNGSSYVRPENP